MITNMKGLTGYMTILASDTSNLKEYVAIPCEEIEHAFTVVRADGSLLLVDPITEGNILATGSIKLSDNFFCATCNAPKYTAQWLLDLLKTVTNISIACESNRFCKGCYLAGDQLLINSTIFEIKHISPACTKLYKAEVLMDGNDIAGCMISRSPFYEKMGYFHDNRDDLLEAHQDLFEQAGFSLYESENNHGFDGDKNDIINALAPLSYLVDYTFCSL